MQLLCKLDDGQAICLCVLFGALGQLLIMDTVRACGDMHQECKDRSESLANERTQILDGTEDLSSLLRLQVVQHPEALQSQHHSHDLSGDMPNPSSSPGKARPNRRQVATGCLRVTYSEVQPLRVKSPATLASKMQAIDAEGAQWQRDVADLVRLAKSAKINPEGIYQEVAKNSEFSQLLELSPGEIEAVGDGTLHPFVFTHGMGDSCFSPSFQRITEAVGKYTGNLSMPNYAVCIPTGDDRASDVTNSYFMNMNENVEVFAKKIMADPKLSGGFNAVGLSQGNFLIRGYIQKYNDPPVKTFISVHGTLSGVASFPHCGPALGSSTFCQMVDRILDLGAYNSIVQNHLFQAGYYRDPRVVNSARYKKYSQLAQWNNEGDTFNPTFRENFAKTETYVMVKALTDAMIRPNEGEWWGHFAPGGFTQLLTMKETEWYKQDMFGLKTVDLRGGIHFETTPRGHLNLTRHELFGWIDKYITKKTNVLSHEAKRQTQV
eukprot:gnl/TRDRNA2_/TRDRNA2_96569_c0_seq1.p1 gnl/TRDRNA2_/TRDRNA2_96569_c0~~gnl/TRDRNA2_/TRDRNA2_96569_c0_seq1.p1  ORF type:complete len:492 (-),score=79.00 gnl/TRDRNA2_/TRDRNA2_96569_c0_seq1:180-1655(-)